MKKFVLIVFALMIVAGAICAFLARPEPEKLDGAWAYKEDENGVTIEYYRGQEADVIIPEKINGQSVISISKDAFRGCDTVSSVTIPGTCKEIDDHAFAECPIRTLHLEEGVEVLGFGCFQGTSLTSVDLPSTIVLIQNLAFSKTPLSKITYSGRIAHIAEGAFEDTPWEKAQPDSQVFRLGSVVFGVKGNMSGTSFNVPEGITAISGLRGPFLSIVFPASLERLWMDSDLLPDLQTVEFQSKSNKDHPLQLEDGIFENFTRLSRVNLSNVIQEMPSGMFKDCSSLVSVTWNEGVSIGSEAFLRCESLQTFSLPDTVTEIGSFAFLGTGLQQITFPEGLLKICKQAFTNCALTKVSIPKGTEVEEQAFSHCDSLCTAVLSCSEVGESMFYECQSLERVELLDGVKTVQKNAFENCSALKQLYIGNSVAWIFPEAFGKSGYSNRLNIIAPEGSYGEVFAHNRNLYYIAGER